MWKKGFTLVEMLAVIVILGAILLIAIPSIQTQVNSRRKEVDERTRKIIISATENLVMGNPDTYVPTYESESNKNTYCFTVQTLIDADMLEEPLKEYSTGREVDHSLGIKVEANKNKEFNYTLLSSGQSCVGKTANLVLYKDSNLKVSAVDSENPYPQIYKGMIPVVYDEDTQSWKKANLYTSWYEYSTDHNRGYRWANAVTVNRHSSDCEATKTCIDDFKSHGRDYYNTAPAGTTISMDDITGMYVWIPKFEYKISGSYGQEYPTGDGAPNVTAPGLINVKFLGLAANADSGFQLPTAFKFSTSSLSGFWMGKFEASADPASNCYKTPNVANCNKADIDIFTVPNRYSWSNIDIANAVNGAIKMVVDKNIHGLQNSETDAHVTKSSEWGAVAILSQSEYGIRHLKGASVAAREVFVNNYWASSKAWTGCSAGKPAANDNFVVATTCSAEHRYDNSSSAAGSTSGTIYGVYDMAGGLWEQVGGTLDSANYGSYQSSLSGKAKYFDKYGTTAEATACNNGICYGHALSETKGWNYDSSAFLTTSNIYLKRGNTVGTKNAQIGIFSYTAFNGAADATSGFRIAITRKGY